LTEFHQGEIILACSESVNKSNHGMPSLRRCGFAPTLTGLAKVSRHSALFRRHHEEFTGYDGNIKAYAFDISLAAIESPLAVVFLKPSLKGENL
jgi:hypothetical protein